MSEPTRNLDRECDCQAEQILSDAMSLAGANPTDNPVMVEVKDGNIIRLWIQGVPNSEMLF